MGCSDVNLLTDDVFSWEDDGGVVRKTSLPGVLAALTTDCVEGFERLQAHQSHAWHAFLVQLAAITLHRLGESAPFDDEDRWRKGLLCLSAERGGGDAWALVSTDLAMPAFLQPPVPEGNTQGWKDLGECPDDIDVLATARNHDVKRGRIVAPSPEDWCYALVSLQTMQGFFGAGNYGIARMNGGFSSRPCVALAPDARLGRRFTRDVAILRDRRAEILGDFDFYKESGGIELLWLDAWDGRQSFALSELDPYFIEVCRRIRLVETDGAIGAHATATKVARIEGKAMLGNTGDPWTPVDAGGKALTLGSAGYSYRLVEALLLSGDYKQPVALRVREDDPERMLFVASGLVRGKGKTDGFHERTIPVPGRIRLMLGSEEGRDRLGALARRRVEDVRTLQSAALRPAVCTLLQAAPDRLDFRDQRADRWVSLHDGLVDEVFFASLWHDIELDDADAQAKWRDTVMKLARRVLSSAEAATPLPAMRKFKAVAAAWRVLEGAARKKFADLNDVGGKTDDGE